MKRRKRVDVESRSPVPQKTAPFLILLLFGVTTYLYLNLFALPHTPFLLGGDQVYFWMDAQRMLNGGRIYQDFLQFTPPGTDLLYFALFKLFGFHIWVTNATVLALGTALCWLCFSIAGKLMERRSALLATVLFLVLVYGKALNGTHHWFSVLAVLSAVRIGMEQTTARKIALAGALLGVASFFSQVHGAAALLAFSIFLLWRQSRTKSSSVDLLRNQALLLLGYTVVLLLLSAHFIAAVGLKQLWYFQVTYVRKYVVHLQQGQLIGLPGALTWRTLPGLSQYLAVYLLLPVAYCVALWQCWRQRDNPSFPWERVALLSTVGFLLLVEVASSPNWLRLYAVSIPGIILLIWTLDRVPKIRHYAVVLMWVGLVCLAARQTVSGYANHSLHAELPGGATATTPQAYEKLHWIMLHTKPGEFFFQSGWPGMYLPLQLRNPLYLDTVGPVDAPRPQDVERAIQQLKTKHVQFILWTAYLDSRCDPGRCEDNLTPLRDYLHSSYVLVQVFPDSDTLWQKRE